MQQVAHRLCARPTVRVRRARCRRGTPLWRLALCAVFGVGACAPLAHPLRRSQPVSSVQLTASRHSPSGRAADAGSGARPRSSVRRSRHAPWGLDRIDQRSRLLDGRFRSDATGAGVTIYIIDSGIRTTHREFAGGRATVGADFVGDGRNGRDCNGHGTFTAGLAGGATYGVAPGARLVALRVAGCDGVVGESALLAALAWIADSGHVRRPAVVNLSLTVNPTMVPPGRLREMERLVRRAIANGVTFVAAAGNRAVDACERWPARMDAVITVSATDRTDARLATSRFAAGYGPCVDLFAPGARLTSAWRSGDHARGKQSGTSGASAYVAGAAALVLARDPTASPQAVAAALIRRATTGQVGMPGPGSPNRLLFIADLGDAH